MNKIEKKNNDDIKYDKLVEWTNSINKKKINQKNKKFNKYLSRDLNPNPCGYGFKPHASTNFAR